MSTTNTIQTDTSKNNKNTILTSNTTKKNNTIDTTIGNNSNTITQTQPLNSNTSQKTTTDIKSYEILTDNYMLLLAITSTIIVLIIIFFFSKSFRVDKSVSRIKIYKQFLQIKSVDFAVFGNTRIGDYFVSSAYNATHSGYQMFDYTSENVVLSILQSGARYLEFNIFNSEFGSKAFPVVSMGYKRGEWKMMVNDTPFELVLDIIANNAFKLYDSKEGVENPDDPLFIGLNLNTNSNLDCLNLIAYLITKKFSERLLTNEYSFQNNDKIADIKMSKLIGKVVVFSSDGFQGSGLEEIINYSWDNTDNNPKHALQRLHYSKLSEPGFNKNKLIEFNRSGFTIIVPHIEGDIANTNYNPIIAFELGCQFITMEFQYIDNNMDHYITKFKEYSFIYKDNNLLKGNTNRKNTNTTNPNTTNPNTVS